jgi:phage terminase large subunit
MGFNIGPVSKGPDSIKVSIDVLQRYRMNVTKSSTNLIKELRNYKWATDKTGKALDHPEDVYNHCCDSIRYVALKKLIHNNSGRYVII